MASTRNMSNGHTSPVSGSRGFWTRVAQLPVCRNVVQLYKGAKSRSKILDGALGIAEKSAEVAVKVASLLPSSACVKSVAYCTLEKVEETVDVVSDTIQCVVDTVRKAVRTAMRTYPGRMSLRGVDCLVKWTEEHISHTTEVKTEHNNNNNNKAQEDSDDIEDLVANPGGKNKQEKQVVARLPEVQETITSVVIYSLHITLTRTKAALIQMSGIDRTTPAKRLTTRRKLSGRRRRRCPSFVRRITGAVLSYLKNKMMPVYNLPTPVTETNGNSSGPPAPRYHGRPGAHDDEHTDDDEDDDDDDAGMCTLETMLDHYDSLEDPDYVASGSNSSTDSLEYDSGAQEESVEELSVENVLKDLTTDEVSSPTLTRRKKTAIPEKRPSTLKNGAGMTSTPKVASPKRLSISAASFNDASSPKLTMPRKASVSKCASPVRNGRSAEANSSMPSFTK